MLYLVSNVNPLKSLNVLAKNKCLDLKFDMTNVFKARNYKICDLTFKNYAKKLFKKKIKN